MAHILGREAMQTILVTGGAGYIGSHAIIELLGKTGWKVISVDNYCNSSAKTYDRIKEITQREFDQYEVDLCDLKALEEVFKKSGRITGIIHFAALKSVPDSAANPLKYYHNNIESLINILKCAEKFRVNNFIFSSSCSVYGDAKTLPVNEQTPLQKAVSAYGHSKQVGEEMIHFVADSNKALKSVILRYFNPVGAHMSGHNGEVPVSRPNNLVPIITQTATGKNSLTVFGNDYNTRDGYCIRDYVHVSDIAEAHVKALEYLVTGKNKNNISLFNLGTGNGVSVIEAIRAFEKVSGRKLRYTIGPRRHGDVMAVYSDISLARKELGWEPRYSLDDMMLSAWKWQQYLDSQEK
jgi:UDP-glucose 4-epimerase